MANVVESPSAAESRSTTASPDAAVGLGATAAPTTPTAPHTHGIPPRGLLNTTSSSTTTGRFGRMFRHVPVFEVTPSSLAVLAASIIQRLEDKDAQGHLLLDRPLGQPDDDENTSRLSNGELRLPAGYTYFGQFVDHDITFDPASSLTRQNDPDALVDFRTPRFDLDSLYGRGPDDEPFRYDADGLKLLEGVETGPSGQKDLPRASNGRAIIGDPRNDENRIVGQLQATFIRFHNRVIDWVAANERDLATSPADHFKRAQQLVRWHYQWVVVHDFLRRIAGDDPFKPDAGVVADILQPEPFQTGAGQARVARTRLLFYHTHREPFMPVEFSVAAYRYGHSMVRPSYHINSFLIGVLPSPRPLPAPEDNVLVQRIPIFTRSGAEKSPGGDRIDLNGFQPLADKWGVEWPFFLHLPSANKDLPQPSYKIDTSLAHPLGGLPDSVAKPELLVPGFPPTIAVSLAFRNLLRGLRLELPAGEDVANAMGIAPAPGIRLDANALKLALDAGLNITQAQIDAAVQDFGGRTPLWYYVLKEAELTSGKDATGKAVNGAHLGAVGGRIVAEVLVGLLAGDPLSFLSVQPDWEPFFPRRDGKNTGPYTLADLVAFASGIVG